MTKFTFYINSNLSGSDIPRFSCAISPYIRCTLLLMYSSNFESYYLRNFSKIGRFRIFLFNLSVRDSFGVLISK